MRPGHWLYTIPLRLRSLFRKAQADLELDDELRDHVERKTEQYVAQGMTQQEAQRRVRLDLGGIEQTKEKCREARRVDRIQDLIQDLRFGLRMLRKSPGFTAVAVLTLAVGIGLNTTLFTAFDAVALKPLPVTAPNSVFRLVRTLSSGSQGDVRYAFSYPEYVYYRSHNHVFAGQVGASWVFSAPAKLPEQAASGSQRFGEPERITGQLVSSNYFAVLGISPALGSTFLSGKDEVPGANPVMVLSYPFWQGRLGSDPQIVGKLMKLNDTEFEVVGVAPQEFIGTANPPIVPDFWAPLAMQPQLLPGEVWLNHPADDRLQLLARLARGSSLRQAQAELTVLSQQFQDAEAQPPRDKTVAVTLQHANYFGDTSDVRFQALDALLMFVAGMVLLVACANLANMLLARGAGRQKEIGTRLAMGASRSRLIQQWLTESILLSFVGGVAGLLVSLWTTSLLRFALTPLVQALLGINPSVIQLAPDLRVFLYTLLLSMATGVAFGLSPALQFSKPHLAAALKDEGTVFSQRAGRSRLRGLLLGTEVAVAMTLLLSAGLLLRGLWKSQTADPGFQTKTVYPLGLYFSNDSAKASALVRRVIARLTDLPAVKSIGLADHVPWSGTWTPPVRVEGSNAPPNSLPWQVLANYVSPGYFPTLGIPILRGRNFTRTEGDTGAPVAIVSEATARQFWPGEDPLGKRIKLDKSFRGDWVEFAVIGVAKDVRTANLSRLDPGYIYVPTDAAKLQGYNLLIRTQGDPKTDLASVVAALQVLDSTQFPPSMQLTSLDQGFMRMQKVVPSAISYFAMGLNFLALILALVGVYGVTAYVVSERTHEVGVRMALGGTVRDILRWSMRLGMRPVLMGIVIGLMGGFGVATLFRAMLIFPGSPDFLFGVSAFDPATFVGSTCFLVGAALLASYIPARRVTKVDPIVALRYE